MPEYDNTNRGVLFKNDKKQTEKHPDYKGNMNAAGTDFWLSAWIKKDKNGRAYMSLSVTPKEDGPARQQVHSQISEDEIPF